MASGLLSFGICVLFAWMLYVHHVPQSAATWGMSMALDTLGLILVIKDGNTKPFLQLGWAAAGLFVLSAVLMNDNQIGWGLTETLSVLFFGVTVWLWISQTARRALWAYMTARYVAFVPLMAQYWDKPQPDTLWLWLLMVVACLLAILGAEKRDFANTFVPWGAIVMNVFIAALCLTN
ncbi:MAG: hypothetical protein NUV60_03545 [Patescibacteria group bacterium]|nr:hypothetical protein [Patescibacteria group bacterium]